MLTFFKINSEQGLQWKEESHTDPITFVIIVKVIQTQFGLSTYLCSNRSTGKAVLEQCDILGHHTISRLSQFDTRLETAISCLDEKMPVVGANALRIFVSANSHRSFTCAALEKISMATDVAGLDETLDLGCPSPL